MLVDIHCHLDSKEFEPDLDLVIQRAKDQGLKVIINNGLNIETNKKTLELSKKYKIIKAALGLYPIDAQSLELNKIEETLNHITKNKNKIIAIGEVGLDFSYQPDIKKQIQIFNKIIFLCERIKKPIIVHSREAEKEVLEILSSSNIKYKILHSFSGSKEIIREAEKNNFYFSIPPSIVRSSNFQTLVDMVPISRIITESDSPYLGIKSHERNEPANISHTIKKISEIKRLNVDEVKNIIFSNYQKIFLK